MDEIEIPPDATPTPETPPDAQTYEFKVRGRSVVLRELSIVEFSACIEQSGGQMTADTSLYGIRKSFVSVDGKPVRYEDVAGIRLAKLFPRPRDMRLVDQAWMGIHMPLDEEKPAASVDIDSYEMVEDRAIFTVELPGARLVKFQEMSTAEYQNNARLHADGWDLTNAGICLTLVSDRGHAPPPLEDINKRTEYLSELFRTSELVLLRNAWEEVHMPSPEEMSRVRGIRA